MPGSVVIHAAVFTAGALLGGGIAVAIANKKSEQTIPIRSSVVVAPAPRPVLEVDAAGKAKVTDTAFALLPPVLKYGNPGREFRGTICIAR